MTKIHHSKSNSTNLATTIKFNAITSASLKIASIILSFISIRLTFKVINSEIYGIWLTIVSILAWTNSFDFGILNGLRNHIGVALASNDFDTIKNGVSNAFAMLLTLSVTFLLLGLLFIRFFDVTGFLNISEIYKPDIYNMLLVGIPIFTLSFFTSSSQSLYNATKLTFITDLSLILKNIATTLFIAYFYFTNHTLSLFNYGISILSLQALIGVIFFIVFFIIHPKFRPSPILVKLSEIKHLLPLSTKFFILQLTSLILFSLINALICKYGSPQDVTNYNLVQKIFSILTLSFISLVNPLWSHVTQAYNNRDIPWIRRTLNKVLIVFATLVSSGILAVPFIPKAINFWIGDEVPIPTVLIMLCLIAVAQSCWNNIFTFIVNGVGSLTTQLFTAISGAILFLPLAYIFSNYLSIGIYGVILASIISLVPSSIAIPFQVYKKILNGNTVS
jgi:O-antigen/teichoic acid export membrane protein